VPRLLYSWFVASTAHVISFWTMVTFRVTLGPMMMGESGRMFHCLAAL